MVFISVSYMPTRESNASFDSSVETVPSTLSTPFIWSWPWITSLSLLRTLRLTLDHSGHLARNLQLVIHSYKVERFVWLQPWNCSHYSLYTLHLILALDYLPVSTSNVSLQNLVSYTETSLLALLYHKLSNLQWLGKRLATRRQSCPPDDIQRLPVATPDCVECQCLTVIIRLPPSTIPALIKWLQPIRITFSVRVLYSSASEYPITRHHSQMEYGI
jgi:hypothetical protein